MENRYKWVFILGFITILLIILSYLVSEKLIRHLDEKLEPVGNLLHPAHPVEMEINDHQYPHLTLHTTPKNIQL